MTTSTQTAGNIRDVVDLLATVRYLNEAVFMAAADSSLTTDATNALQALSAEIGNKLLFIDERLDEILEVQS
ncbi:hypothetical protein IB270_07670 [Ensifer sp. ENS05]|uniref:hypothetical protein n=1 Tax=Ensifer sp. ENS05 TaxID=2769277 RepID=UPI0017805A7F|nr:hypothetical protein [Ensifer sp. ENS05]MBD9592707.1 hypothetical protein [Ensifer sp. ENS05]